jgi:phytanoyl-CoA hydroxylase
VLPGFASAEEVAALKREGESLLAGCDPEANPSVFSTRRQTATTDEYFLQSGNNVSFFLCVPSTLVMDIAAVARTR